MLGDRREEAISEPAICPQVGDETLMGSLVQGDPTALRSIYNRHRGFLYGLALRITGNVGEAEEILQDTFFQLWRKSSHFDPARGSLLAWLLTITRNGAISCVRRRKNGFNFNTDDIGDGDGLYSCAGPSDFLTQHIARDRTSAALAALSAAQLEAVTLAYFDGWTCQEIATRTQTPVGTVKTRLRRALKLMRVALRGTRAPAPARYKQRPTTLENILITEQLLSRVSKERNLQDEMHYLQKLQQIVTASPENLIDEFLKMPLELCQAGTAGLSLLETTTNGEQVFRWTNLAGQLAKYTGGSTPRNFSPCGVTLDRKGPQLFAYPGRHFKYFNDVEFPIVEGLVIPFRVGDDTEGTVWIVSHDERFRFDAEDARIMTQLAEVVGCALYLMKAGPPKRGANAIIPKTLAATVSAHHSD